MEGKIVKCSTFPRDIKDNVCPIAIGASARAPPHKKWTLRRWSIPLFCISAAVKADEISTISLSNRFQLPCHVEMNFSSIASFESFSNEIIHYK
jgi:hypothetical protein